MFPPDHIWNVPVDSLPLDAYSADYVQSIGAGQRLHPDFGSGYSPAGLRGIPFVIVPPGQPMVPVEFKSEESDPGPYPIPPKAPVEGEMRADSLGDRHVLVLQSGACKLFELFHAYPSAIHETGWSAGSGAVFDLRSYGLRPKWWTSADAAGLPILPGLVRYDEVKSGEIRHAIRFTAPRTQRAFVWPGRHRASKFEDKNLPPMGQRFRLRADFNTSGFPPQARVILNALKRYGMILSDNGQSWFITGAPDEGWDNRQLITLHQVRGFNFEAVDVSSLMIDENSGQTKAAGKR